MGTLNTGTAGQVIADQWLNSDGTENYKCRAWVDFNGTGTVAIYASKNVSSITDNGVGDYTVNFTVAMSDTNYATSGGGHRVVGSGFLSIGISSATGSLATNKLTTSVRISSVSAGGYEDPDDAALVVHR